MPDPKTLQRLEHWLDRAEAHGHQYISVRIADLRHTIIPAQSHDTALRVFAVVNDSAKTQVELADASAARPVGARP